MAEEQVFLNEGNVYVSNTKAVFHGTTYATANITSVSKRFTPPNKGCALTLIAFGALGVLGTIGTFKAAQAGESLGATILAAVILVAGVFWLRALKPTFHVVLSSSSGEKEGMSSKDNVFVDKVITAITDAITHRG